VTGRPADRPFPRDILAGGSLAAARALLGAVLVREPDRPGDARRTGRIVEVEAYLGLDDRASHARMGPTPRNQVMFGPPGMAYVYLVYGMHHCLNVVTEAAGRPAAVLVRAVEPLAGLEALRAARGPRAVADHRLAAGPGLVGAAFGIDRSLTGTDLCDPEARLHLASAPDGTSAPVIAAGPRIGIAYAGEPWASAPWRFAVAGSPSLSRRIG
jgi:DNA-3-methyladenine glycosylase